MSALQVEKHLNKARSLFTKGKEAEAKEPVRKEATKGPIFKGTYLQRTGAAGGQLKFMIRLGERAIERMVGTYEKAKTPRQGHER